MKVLKFAAVVIIVAGVTTLLVVGKSLLIPLFLAIVVWYLINANYELLKKLPLGKHLPKGLGLGLSAIIIIGILYLIANLLTQNINSMIEIAPVYRVNIENQLGKILTVLGLSKLPDYDAISKELNIMSLVNPLLNGIRGMAQNFFLVIIYVAFLLMEQESFPKKLAALRLSEDRKKRMKVIFTAINKAARSYWRTRNTYARCDGRSYATHDGVNYATGWN